MKKIRLGAVNWDASLPPSTYFGFYQTNSLSQAKYREWCPFYAEIIDEERITYRERSPEEYDEEIRYAILAGIDYFAYVWYPTEGSRLHKKTNFNDCSHKVHELNYARKLYEKSSLKDKMNMCAILSAHPFTDGDLLELVDTFSKPYYEKIGNRPLLYVYGGYRADIIEKIHNMCKEREIPTPYTVPMVSDATGEKMPFADALSAYTVSAESVGTNDELIDDAIEKNRRRISYSLGLIPTFSVGWNPSPRIDRPTPWTSKREGVSIYPDTSYAPRATCDELLSGALRFADFIKKEAMDCFVGHILTFAWNEFEEGGYICPTYMKNGNIDHTRVEIFAKIASHFRDVLCGE